MRSCTKIDNSKKDILILGKGSTKGLEHTVSSEKIHSINLLEIIKNSVWADIVMEQTVINLLMAQKFITLKQKFLKLWQVHYV